MSDKNIDKDIKNVKSFIRSIKSDLEEDAPDNFKLAKSIENVLSELETKNKIINTTINYVLNNTHIEHDGDDYGYTEWIEIDTDTTTFITTLKNILKNEVLKDE